MSEVFLDTSIAIARVTHGPETKKRIKARLAKHEVSLISSVVRQEFKRRLLKEAQYLLRQFNEKRTLKKVRRHVIDVLGPLQARKRNICLETLELVFERNNSPVSEKELTERAVRTLRSLLRVGLADLSKSVTFEIDPSKCACAQYPVTEKVKYKKYEFGPEECVKTGTSCGIEKLNADRVNELKAILAYLQTLPNKTDELKKSESFIAAVLADPSNAIPMNPCLTVGDLVIALESVGIQTFYTFNRKESLHFCKILKQNLVIRPKNPIHDDQLFSRDSTNAWPLS